MRGRQFFWAAYLVVTALAMGRIVRNVGQRRLRTELVAAVGRGDAGAAGRLLAQGANPEARDRKGRTALHLAVLRGEAKVARVLLEGGTRADSAPDLLAAAARHDVPVMALLLAFGARVGARGANGETALAACVEQGGGTGAAAFLLGRGADPNARDRWGRSPLMRALRLGHRRQARLMADRISDPNASDRGGRTLLMCAAAGRDPGMTARLLALGAEADAQDLHGQTALLHALRGARPRPVGSPGGESQADFDAVTRRLLPKGNGLRARRERRDALQMALSCRQAGMVRTLLDEGADPRAPGPGGCTPLAVAAMTHQLWAAELLLQRGADPDARQHDGKTPLAGAVYAGDAATTALLLQHGADPDRPDAAGRSPRDWARLLKRHHLARLLAGNAGY